MTKKVFIKTLGCQMNVRDSEVIGGLLRASSYELTANQDEADIIIFNTCSVRQHAEDKVWSEVGRLKRTTHDARRTTNHPIIGIIGCMAQNYKEEIFKRAPNVDFVVGPQDLAKIPEILKKLEDARPTTHDPRLFELKIWETDGKIRSEEIYHTGFHADKEYAYVVISEGCSNYCSYCVVPYVRGELRSRSSQDILQEIVEVVDKGITRVTLLGQNVNAYQVAGRTSHATCDMQPATVDFIKLLEMVNEIKGLKEFSFITSHPKDTNLDLFKAMADLEKLRKYLHLPVQSGSDRILKLMNRGYTRKLYIDLIENYRKIVKNGVLTTDIIVGFPNEKEEDFNDTYNLVKEIVFNAAYIFKYSPRAQTEAAKMADDVAKEEKEKRHYLILELQKKISKKIKC